MNYIDLFIVILIIGFSFVYVRESFMEVSYIKSTVDGKKYLVQNRKNAVEAANLLANINKNLIKLINILKQKYSDDPRAKRMINNYNPDTITEGTGEKNYTSYSVNKGEKIVFCITVRNDENNKKLMDLNTMLYVGIHELAHLGTKEIAAATRARADVTSHAIIIKPFLYEDPFIPIRCSVEILVSNMEPAITIPVKLLPPRKYPS